MMENGFEIVRNMYDINNHSLLITNLFDYTKMNIKGSKDDPQTPGAPAFYKDIEMNKVQIKLLSKMEEATGFKLYPTYTYYRIYNSKSILGHSAACFLASVSMRPSRRCTTRSQRAASSGAWVTMIRVAP